LPPRHALTAPTPSPLQDAITCLCGPPGMIQFACLPNLEKMGFKEEQMIQF
jgi:hypothetical protein